MVSATYMESLLPPNNKRGIESANSERRWSTQTSGASGAVDVATSSGRFDADPQRLFDQFDEIRKWADSVSVATEPFDPRLAGPPVPRPRQVFAVALNYVDHAAESGFTAPKEPVIFTKYPSSFSGPYSKVNLHNDSIDWEVEIVAVMSHEAKNVKDDDAWSYVAGLTLGQDLSDRETQFLGPVPQFGLAKSFGGFSPMGPALVGAEHVANRDAIALGCEIDGEEVQRGSTSSMIFSIPELVSYLSSIVTLYPGDVIFTGTPPGVGMGRTPKRYLRNGEHLRSWGEGLGELHQDFVAPDPGATSR